MTSERRIWLVRHGETEGQSSVRYHGSNDVALSDLGREQIRGLIPFLEGVALCDVVHSPQLRATESATLLRDGLSLDHDLLRVEERMREICFGEAEGMTREEINAAFPAFWEAYEAGRTDAFPGGEPRASFMARVAAAARELAAAPWSGDVLLVAHRGVVKYTIRALLEPANAPQDAFEVELGSLSVLRQASGAWTLEALGMRPEA